MPESPSPLDHLTSSLEELLRAGAAGLARLRERTEGPVASAGSLERLIRDLADELDSWLARADSPLLGPLRAALRAETRRWEFRAAEDPAARRVHDLFALLLDALGDDAEPTRSTTPRPRRAPPRAPRSQRPEPR